MRIFGIKEYSKFLHHALNDFTYILKFLNKPPTKERLKCIIHNEIYLFLDAYGPKMADLMQYFNTTDQVYIFDRIASDIMGIFKNEQNR